MEQVVVSFNALKFENVRYRDELMIFHWLMVSLTGFAKAVTAILAV